MKILQNFATFWRPCISVPKVTLKMNTPTVQWTYNRTSWSGWPVGTVSLNDRHVKLCSTVSLVNFSIYCTVFSWKTNIFALLGFIKFNFFTVQCTVYNSIFQKKIRPWILCKMKLFICTPFYLYNIQFRIYTVYSF